MCRPVDRNILDTNSRKDHARGICKNDIGDGGDISNTQWIMAVWEYGSDLTKNFIQSDFNDFDVGRGEVP